MSQIFGKLGREPLQFQPKPLFLDVNSSIPALSEQLAFQTEQKAVPHDFMSAGGPSENDKQFYLYQLGDKVPLIDPHNVDPDLDGTDKEPDAFVTIELESFNFSRTLNVDPDTNATLRLDVGKDKQSNSNLDLLVWSVASAINLAKQFDKGTAAKPSDINFKSADVFKSGPAQIPGSLGTVTIEVVKHEKPSLLEQLWDDIYEFFTGPTGSPLIATLGFPSITPQVLDFLNDVFSKFAETSAEPLFQSQPLTVALTKRAKSDFSTPGTLVASLNSGRYVFTRQADAATLSKACPILLGGVGALVPKADYEKNPNGYDLSSNPFNDITYGILRVRSKTTQLAWSPT